MSACLAVRDHDKLDLKSKESDKSKTSVYVTRQGGREGEGGEGGGEVLSSRGLLGVCTLIEVEFFTDFKT